MNISIFIISILSMIVLAIYVIAEGQRKKSQKKFIKNMNEFDSKKNKI